MMHAISPSISKKPLTRGPIAIQDRVNWLLVLVVMVFFSALLLIYVKYQNQQLYIQLHNLQTEAQHLHQEKNMLTLEKATLSSLKRVYQYAEKQGMRVPNSRSIVIID
jgi:cell division protein FtsL